MEKQNKNSLIPHPLIVPFFTEQCQLINKLVSLCKELHSNLWIPKKPDFLQMQIISKPILEVFLFENTIKLDWSIDETVSVSDFKNPFVMEQFTFILLLERLYELAFKEYKEEDFEFYLDLCFNVIKKIKNFLPSIFNSFYDAYDDFITTKDVCHFYQYLLGVEAFYPALSLNDSFIKTINVFKFKAEDCFYSFSFDGNKQIGDVYQFLCHIFNLDAIKVPLKIINSIGQETYKDPNVLKPIDDILLNKHIDKMKSALKTLIVIKYPFYLYANQYIVGRSFEALTIIDEYLMLPEQMLGFLDNQPDTKTLKIGKSIILVSILHEIAHIKRRTFSINSPYRNTPRSFISSLYSDGCDTGEIGYWFEEQIFGLPVNTSAIGLDHAEIILSLKTFEKKGGMQLAMKPFEKILNKGNKKPNSCFKLKDTAMNEENKIEAGCGCSEFGVKDQELMKLLYKKIKFN